MRFVLGPMPPSEVLDAEAERWTPLTGQDSKRLAVAALLIPFSFQVPAILVLSRSLALVRADGKALSPTFISFVVCLVLMVPLHEFVHATAYLKGLRSHHLVMGLWLRRGMCYVIYDSPMPRNRLLLMSAAPFCVLSLGPAVLLPFLSSAWRPYVLMLLFIHSSLCGGDFIILWRVFTQVRRTGWLHNKGWTTYWTPKQPKEDC